MGNCQAAEASTVVIQHPGGKIERIYWSISANEIMNSNPGHYVALVVTSPTLKSENGSPVKQLKLLKPDDTLLFGHVYRLVSFEDVLKEFAAKKCVKLGKLLEKGGLGLNVMMKKKKKGGSGGSNPINVNSNLSSENCRTVQGIHHRYVQLHKYIHLRMLSLLLLNTLSHLPNPIHKLVVLKDV